MKRLIIFFLIILSSIWLEGCKTASESSIKEVTENTDDFDIKSGSYLPHRAIEVLVITDKETGVDYIVVVTHGGCGITPRLKGGEEW